MVQPIIEELKIPIPFIIGRCQVIYYTYLVDNYEYTYFYPTYACQFFGYEKTTKKPKSSAQYPVIKVKSDIALQQLL